MAALVEQIVAMTEQYDRRSLSYHFFFNADRSKIFGIEIHADEAALVSHMETVGELAAALFSIANVERVVALGAMSPDLRSALAPFNPVFHEERIAGFTR